MDLGWEKIQLKRHKTLKVFEAFAGYGGASFGLKRSGVKYKVIGYSEIDQEACQIYSANFPNIKNWGDITQIPPKKLPNFDLFTGGFPCQPFSNAGKRLGENDERGILYKDILRICNEKKPQYILLENVKGLLQKRNREIYKAIITGLQDIGYDPKCVLLNSKDYGIPQSRERLWIFASLTPLPLNFSMTPPTIHNGFKLKDFLDKDVDPHLYRTEKQVEHLKKIHHNDFIVDEPLCFDIYNKKMKTDGLCMTLTPPEHNIVRFVEPPINGKPRVRKPSINEHFRLMGFDDGELCYANLSYNALGRRAGNGWDVNLTGILINYIFSQIFGAKKQ